MRRPGRTNVRAILYLSLHMSIAIFRRSLTKDMECKDKEQKVLTVNHRMGLVYLSKNIANFYWTLRPVRRKSEISSRHGQYTTETLV